MQPLPRCQGPIGRLVFARGEVFSLVEAASFRRSADRTRLDLRYVSPLSITPEARLSSRHH